MSCTDVERCLATLFTHADARRAFLRSPEAVLDGFELTAAEREGLLAMDKAGLVLAGNSFSAKRAKYNRWMHAEVKPILAFDGLVEPDLLAQAQRFVLASARPPEAVREVSTAVLKRHDYFAWDADSHHNREHMLDETDGAQALMRIWLALKDAVLLNHHLLRCYAVSGGSPAKLTIHREHPRPGTYLSYVCLGPDRRSGWVGDLVLHYENKAEVTRLAVGQDRCLVVPADILQRYDAGAVHTAGGPLFLVFKSLAAIQ